MKKVLFPILVVAYMLAGTAIAAGLPSYYPAKGFQNIGRVDAVYPKEGRVVIGDVSYEISTSVVVRSLSSKSDALARIRQGANVGFRTRGDVIQEFWLLPSNYDASKRR